MLRAGWSSGLIVSHASRLVDAAHDLLERGASCILLEASRPGADELSALDQVRSTAPDIPIVMISSVGDGQQGVSAIAAGAQDYLLMSELSPTRLTQALRYAIERKHAETQLAFQALHDPLTGLPNRALYLDRLGVALDRSRRTGATVAVLFLDVDRFKRINDTFGHAAGDQLLIGLADRLRSTLRPMDTVARLGGDEFTFLFEDLAGEREAVLITERIRHVTSLPITLETGVEISLTVSIGITIVADPRIAPDVAIREADAAMYRAKELGRDRYERFDDSSHPRT
jgi:two-component system, cell cycle response regulator